MAENSNKRLQKVSTVEPTVKKKPKRTAEGIKSKRESDRRRRQTRVTLGVAFPRWRALKAESGLRADTDFALLLMDSYERYMKVLASVKAEGNLQAPPPPSQSSNGTEYHSITIDWEGEDDRGDPISDIEVTSNLEEDTESLDEEDCDTPPHFPSDSATKTPLPSASMEESVCDVGESEELPMTDITSGPDYQLVLCEDDIVGEKASIAYEKNLRQLAGFLRFPLEKCEYSDPLLGVECDAVQPFDIVMESQGTASTIEWVCSRGHSLWKWNSQPVFKFGMQSGDFMLATNILLSGNDYDKIALLFQYMNMNIVAKSTFTAVQHSYCVNTIKEFWQETRYKKVYNKKLKKYQYIIKNQKTCTDILDLQRAIVGKRLGSGKTVPRMRRRSSSNPDDPESDGLIPPM
uniref:uncharacterized protein LOC122782635 n=1 Tax=Solea senegalensis TaxID=28829 RepID=UPI001CD87F4E|nr:uncharacterized protein LOC122782635 [Solea senegalensis]